MEGDGDGWADCAAAEVLRREDSHRERDRQRASKRRWFRSEAAVAVQHELGPVHIHCETGSLEIQCHQLQPVPSNQYSGDEPTPPLRRSAAVGAYTEVAGLLLALLLATAPGQTSALAVTPNHATEQGSKIQYKVVDRESAELQTPTT